MPTPSQEIQTTPIDFSNAAIFISRNANQSVAPHKVLKAKNYPGYFSDNSLRFLAGNNGKIYARKKGLVLGEGAFGVVSHACDKDGNQYAIKDIKHQAKNNNEQSKLLDEVDREFHFAYKLSVADEVFQSVESHSDDDNNKTISFVKSQKQKSPRKSYSIVHKYLGIDLREYLKRNTDISLDRKKKIMIGMIQAVLRAHAQNIVHRDIKLENFVINPDTLEVTLIDYGFAAYTNELVVLKGTPTHISPRYLEHWNGDIQAALLCFDVFALLRSLYAGNVCCVINGVEIDGDKIRPALDLYSVCSLFTKDEVELDPSLQKIFSHVDVMVDSKFNVKNYPSVKHLYVSALFMLHGVEDNAFYFDNQLIDYFSHYLQNQVNNQSNGISKNHIKDIIIRSINAVSKARNGCWDDVQSELNSCLVDVPVELYQILLFEALSQKSKTSQKCKTAIRNFVTKLTSFDFKNDQGLTPLDCAQLDRNYIASAMMVDQIRGGEAVGPKNFFNRDRILVFLRENNENGLCQLVEYFENPESLRDHLERIGLSSSAIFSRAIKLNIKPLLDFLVNSQDFLSQENGDGIFPIVLAAKTNKWRIVRLIIEKQPYFGVDAGYSQALDEAICVRNIDATVALLKSGVPYESRNFALVKGFDGRKEQVVFLKSLLDKCLEKEHVKKIIGGIILIKAKQIGVEIKAKEKAIARLSFIWQLYDSKYVLHPMRILFDCLSLVFKVLSEDVIKPYQDEVISQYVQMQQACEKDATLDQESIGYIKQVLLLYMSEKQFDEFCEEERARTASCFSCCFPTYAKANEL